MHVLGPSTGYFGQRAAVKCGIFPLISCRVQLSEWCLQDSSQLSNTWTGIVFISVKSVNDGACACASPSCTYARGFDLDSEAWAADPDWRSVSFFPHCYPINILSKSPLLKYSILQFFSAFSQKCALAFHFRRWSENKQFLGLLNQEVHRIYLFTDSIFWSDLSWNSISCEFRSLQPFYNISAAV